MKSARSAGFKYGFQGIGMRMMSLSILKILEILIPIMILNGMSSFLFSDLFYLFYIKFLNNSDFDTKK